MEKFIVRSTVKDKGHSGLQNSYFAGLNLLGNLNIE
jgi:hypothetical protein